MSIEAMHQALEALELLAKWENPSTKWQVRKPKDGGPIVTIYPHKVATDAATLLRERLAQPEQKTCLVANESCKHESWCSEVYCQEHCEFVEQAEQAQPKCGAIIEVFGKDWRLEYMNLPVGRHKLYTQQYEYTAPPPRQPWVGLTAEEIWQCNTAPAGHHVECHICVAHQNVLDFAEAIEAKLKEKNVDGVTISEERVDETAKGEHEPVAFECPRCGHCCRLEWVGLTMNEAKEFYEKYTDRAELINALDKFLEEKNT
jgi:hypothetical protein